MDKSEIKNIILANLKTIFNVRALWAKAKEAMKLPYAKTYMALSLAFLVIFFIFTFPYDVLIRRSMKNLEKSGAVRSIEIPEMDFSLMTSTLIKNLMVVTQSGGEINMRSADINVSLLRFVIRKNIKGAFQLAGFNYQSDTGTTQIDLNINGNINLTYQNYAEMPGMPRGGEFNVIIDNVIIKMGEFNLPESMGSLPLNLPLIKISSIKLEGNIEQQKMNITSMRIFGKDLKGSITGSIALAQSLANSRLDLRVLMDANSELLTNYKDLLGKFINDRNQLAFNLKGALARPSIDLNQSGPGSPPARTEHPMDKVIPMN